MRTAIKTLLIVFLVGGLTSLYAQSDEKWWESVPAIKLVSLKEPDAAWGQRLTLQDSVALAGELQGIVEEGYGAIEVIAPAHGGIAWGGLDSENFYNLDPERGNMEDFRRLVRQAHSAGLKVMVFFNIGYMGKDHPDWIQAQQEALTDANGEKASWFVWSDTEDAEQIDNPFGEQEIIWAYSEIAQKYYASVWQAAISWDPYEEYPTPQMNWNSSWQEEAIKIMRHWMDTGLDGISMDAPLEYFNTAGTDDFWDGQKNVIADIVNDYNEGDVFIVGEAMGGLQWINRGGYDAMWDYDILYTRIEGSERNAIKYAVDNGEARYIERGLRYRKQIVEEGGTLLTQFPNFYGGVSSKRHLYMALLISIGEALFSHPEGIRTDEEITRLLSMKSEYPALWNQSTRMQLITNDDDKYYSVLHTSKDGTQEIISVFNFQNEEARINIPLSDVQMRNLKDVSTGEIFEYTDDFKIALPARGYRFFLLTNEAANVVIPSIDLSVTVYPNPVNEFLNVNIEISPPKSISIQLIDVLGRIYSESSNEIPVNEEYSTSINMLHLPSGLYFLRIGTNAQEITRKILRF